MGCCAAPQKKAVVQPSVIKKKKETDFDSLKKKYQKQILDWVVSENQQELKTAIDEGFTPDLIFDSGGQDSTMMILSIVYKKKDITDFLLQIKQNINLIVPPNNESALLCAVINEDVQLVQNLLNLGADPNVNGPNQLTVFQIAQKNYNKVVDQLGEEAVPQLPIAKIYALINIKLENMNKKKQ